MWHGEWLVISYGKWSSYRVRIHFHARKRKRKIPLQLLKNRYTYSQYFCLHFCFEFLILVKQKSSFFFPSHIGWNFYFQHDNDMETRPRDWRFNYLDWTIKINASLFLLTINGTVHSLRKWEPQNQVSMC